MEIEATWGLAWGLLWRQALIALCFSPFTIALAVFIAVTHDSAYWYARGWHCTGRLRRVLWVLLFGLALIGAAFLLFSLLSTDWRLVLGMGLLGVGLLGLSLLLFWKLRKQDLTNI